MARNKTDRRALQARKKEEKRRKNRLQQRKSLERANENRLDVRFAKQVAASWQGEALEDVALFDDSALARLPAESALEAKWVRQALAEACDGKPGPAFEQLSEIPRRSPFAEWRIFLRGLERWKNQNLTEAQDVWARLDSSRRAWRIAASLVFAYRNDLTEIRHQGLAKYCATTPTNDPWLVGGDDQLLLHAKLVRQVRIDRVALRDAMQVTKLPNPDDEDLTVSPAHIQWLKDFTEQYKKVDPALVQALQQAAVARAFCGRYSDIFDICCKSFRGMPHDPEHQLMSMFVHLIDAPLKKWSQGISRYIENDLKRNQLIPPTLRSAIISQLYCKVAAIEIRKSDQTGFGSAFFSAAPDWEFVENCLKKALEAYPANRSAYEGYETIYRDRLEDGRLLKSQRNKLQLKLSEIQARRLQHLPDDIETRLELVDYLLETEQSERANEHVEWLAGTPRENPLADAMTWKWNLLEAMRMCRRKNTIGQAGQFLDGATQEWPQWLSRDWLPYLRAALELRGGNAQAFDEMPSSARVNSQLADLCMRLGAAQKMSLEAARLKPLRDSLEQLLANLEEIPVADLLSAASFFWDLHRTGLKYPAYRMHGTKFLWQLLAQFNATPRLVTEHLEDHSIQAALLVMANESMFNTGYEIGVPSWLLEPELEKVPIVNAVNVIATSGLKHLYRIEMERPQADLLRQSAASISDSYYRYYFQSLANQLDEKIERLRNARRDPLAEIFRRLGSIVGKKLDEDGELADSLNEFLEDSDDCDCFDCRRSRGEI